MKQHGTARHAKSWLGLAVTAIVIVFAMTAHAAGPKLVAAFFVKGKVGLKWQESADVAEYTVYRKSADSDFEKIATTDEDHYFDTELVPGAVYTYKISAPGNRGAEEFSGEKSVTIPAAAAGEFKPPTWSGLRIDQDKIFLNFDAVPGAIAYNIHRSTTSGEGYEIIGNSQSSKYADKEGLVKGTTYYYAVSALNSEFEETELSTETHIKFGMSLEEQKALQAEANKIELVDIKLTKLFQITEVGGGDRMNQPADVFLNSVGDIYVTDALHAKVHCFDGSGKFKFSFGELMDKNEADNPPPGAFQLPFTLCIDGNDNVYVTDIDAHDIQVFTADGKFVRRIRVDVGDGMDPLRPNGIHVLKDGRIVVTDTGNHRYLIIDSEGKILFAKGEKGDGPGQFLYPNEVTVTADNTVCIVDVINCRIQEFDLAGNFIREFGQVGQSAGTFGRPAAIAIDDQGWIWVADGMSNMIQAFTQEGEVKAAIGTNKDESISFDKPRGIFFRAGKLYVVNRLAHQVAVYKIG